MAGLEEALEVVGVAEAGSSYDLRDLDLGGLQQPFDFLEAPLAQAFRALPAVEIDTVSDADGVVVRRKTVAGVEWAYVVNTTGEPRTVSVELPAGILALLSVCSMRPLHEQSFAQYDKINPV